MGWREWLGLAPGDEPRSVTASAMVVTDDVPYTITPQKTSWQDELWKFYDDLGEYTFVVDWKAAMASRVRLRAGRMGPESDEPTIETEGPVPELVLALAGGTGGQAGIMADLMTQLTVPGEGWLVGQTVDDSEKWRVVSTDEIRRMRGRGTSTEYEVIDENSPPATPEWVPLGPDSVVVRIWRPHPRFHYQANSKARSARTTMQELELANRKIVSQYLSRLSSAGMLVLPDEVEFPVREEFLSAANPFFAELIAVATEAIRTPGSAAATVPIPITVPSEYAASIKHIDFTLKLDEKEVEKRESAIRRLSIQLDVPAEILTGVGSSNHWSAWAIEEQALKTHIAPDIELICTALTIGYLHPRMKASGEDPEDWVVWYDASEIVQRPDKTANANDAYDRMEIGGEAYRREAGFDEADAPDDEEVEQMALRRLAVQPATAFQALDMIMGRTPEPAEPIPGAPGTEQLPPEGESPGGGQGPPGTEGEPAPPPQGKPPAQRGPSAAARDLLVERLLIQAASDHVVTFSPDGSHQLQHPRVCREHLGSCPFTHAIARGIGVRPGASGAYTCTLVEERISIGSLMHRGTGELITYTPERRRERDGAVRP